MLKCDICYEAIIDGPRWSRFEGVRSSLQRHSVATAKTGDLCEACAHDMIKRIRGLRPRNYKTGRPPTKTKKKKT